MKRSFEHTQICNTIRKQGGSVLGFMLGLSVLAGLWILATSMIVVPAYEKISLGRQETLARGGAEAALDWACDQLNQRVTNPTGNLSLQDDISNDGVPNPTGWSSGTAVPNSALPANVTAQVWVNDVAPGATTYLYDPQLDPVVNTTIVGGNGWRTITVQSVCGKKTKMLRVVLKPYYTTGVPTQTTTIVTTNPFVNGFFTQGFFADNGNHASNIFAYNSNTGPPSVSATTMGAPVGSNGYNVGSNTPISFGSNTTIDGSVSYYGTPGTAGHPSVTGGTITGDLYTNDTLAVAQSGESPQGNLATGTDHAPIHASDNAAPISLANPTPPSGATQLAAGYSGSLAAGTYVTTSLTGVITPTGNGPVRIYVQNNLNLAGGSGDLSGYNASKLQIFYAGSTGSIALSGAPGQFCGCVYAPNLPATISGQGHFFGSLIAENCTFNGGGNSGGFSYDDALNGNANVQMDIPVTTTSPTIVVSHLTAVSWQEM